MRYNYPLQKIVDLKESQTRQAKWVLSSAVDKMQSVQQQLQALYEERRRMNEALEQKSRTGVSAQQLQECQQYLDYLDELCAHRQAELMEANQKVDVARSDLSTKMQHEKVWTKAREKSMLQFIREMQKKEQNELDDLASARQMVSYS